MRIKQELTEQETMMQMPTEPKADELTGAEQKAFLDAMIRRRVSWAVKSNEVPAFHENNDVLIAKVASRIYDDVVSDFNYNKTVLKATRAVKFNTDYVAKVVRSGLSSGSIALNENVAKELDTLTEGILSADDLEQRIHGITCLVARESRQR
jgi:hypothetical protein